MAHRRSWLVAHGDWQPCRMTLWQPESVESALDPGATP